MTVHEMNFQMHVSVTYMFTLTYTFLTHPIVITLFVLFVVSTQQTGTYLGSVITIVVLHSETANFCIMVL